jgi:hypothetical protein
MRRFAAAIFGLTLLALARHGGFCLSFHSSVHPVRQLDVLQFNFHKGCHE